MQDILIPPFCLFTIRVDRSFMVYDLDAKGERVQVIGPENSNRRVMRIETADNQRAIGIESDEDAMISTMATVRPSPYEKNSGIPSELTAPISPPTIQEMIQQYVREAIGKPNQDDLEKPEEFFDFGPDDDDTGHLLSSAYEEMEPEEVPIPPVDLPDAPTAPEEPSEPPAPQTPTPPAEPGANSAA